jgi:peptidoglycan/xylan/chitin deacetylase (PgdA/CDA1 family)
LSTVLFLVAGILVPDAAAGWVALARPVEVLFTFDDGPALAYSAQIAERLEEYGGRAVFFVNGTRFSAMQPDAEARRHLLRTLRSRGHLIGNHTFRHQNLCARGADIDGEIDGNEALLTDILGVRPTLFRAPYGVHCDSLQRAIAERPHLTELGWTVDPQEWNGSSEAGAAIIAHIRQLPPGTRAIILMHDAHPAARLDERMRA